MTSLSDFLTDGPYQSYVYSYPHKTAYRPLASARPLANVWEDESMSSLFLYAHVPFCEMRCGFCNLFTTAKPGDDLADQYVAAFRRQAEATRDALPSPNFTRLAIGGGTPTQLSLPNLTDFLSVLTDVMGVDAQAVPVGCEMSPETVTPAKMKLLREFGVNRASIGIQSFVPSETKSLRRPQALDTAMGALDAIRMAGFETLNIDLIYGIAEQTPDTWRQSLAASLEFQPEELYLYPLYVRPLTGLGNSKRSWDDQRQMLYRQGRDYLLEHGYEQVTMRMFHKRSVSAEAAAPYRCQEDGMVGLGAGARSYTENLHYSCEYAVGRRGVLDIIKDYNKKTMSDFNMVNYGFALSDGERKTRFALLSLLSEEGLSDADYAQRFRAQPMDDFPQLVQLVELKLATKCENRLVLTPSGYEFSDAIGPWLYSKNVRDLSEAYELS